MVCHQDRSESSLSQPILESGDTLPERARSGVVHWGLGIRMWHDPDAPEVPGINAPGDYMKDYAPHPGDYALKVMDKAGKGTYEHYFPPPPRTIQ